jgi:hypothetical protein
MKWFAETSPTRIEVRRHIQDQEAAGSNPVTPIFDVT